MFGSDDESEEEVEVGKVVVAVDDREDDYGDGEDEDEVAEETKNQSTKDGKVEKSNELWSEDEDDEKEKEVPKVSGKGREVG